MKTIHEKLLIAVTLAMTLAAGAPSLTAQTAPRDPGWPRVFEKDGKKLTIYQPQVDDWEGYTNLHFHCAIAVDGVSSDQQYGMIDVNATTVTDQATRMVAITPVKRKVTFPNRSDSEVLDLRAAVDQLAPLGKTSTLSLDRVVAYLDPATQPHQRAVNVNLNPPTIYYSSKPAILVMFMGAPQFKPVVPGNPALTFAVNSNWDILYDAASQRYFLLNGVNWLTAPNPLKGPWTPAGALPASFSLLPSNDNWSEVRSHIPGRPAKDAPTVFASTQPAELIVTAGQPSYAAIAGTKLMRVANTDSALFQDTSDKTFYLLVAGRWFRAPDLNGTWTAASNNLPPDFAKIPDTDPSAPVKASVPGTREAKEAVLLASVPTTTTVNVATPSLKVSYNGAPQFQPIQGTTVQYAVNSPNSVFLVDGGYYCCDQGVWFTGTAPNGPWAYCTSVPPAIYNIPPTSPVHNVTYVGVQSSSPTSVTYQQTGGYSGEYVAPDDVLMYGAGMSTGPTNVDNSNYDNSSYDGGGYGYGYSYPYYPAYYSYGCGALYDHAYGGYYNAARVYGPYGGAGKTAAYNPATGTYSRSAYAYGPYDSASARQAYNPYTHTYAQTARVNTPAGSASRTYVQHGDESAYGGTRTSAYGTAGAVKTSSGAAAAGYDTKEGQGAVVKTQSGNYYADRNGNVYMKDASGGWTTYNGHGWQPVSKLPEQTARPATETTETRPQTSYGGGMSQESLQAQEQARQRGAEQSERASQYRYGGGGGGRR